MGMRSAVFLLFVLGCSRVVQGQDPQLSCQSWSSPETCNQVGYNAFTIGTAAGNQIGAIQCNDYMYHGSFSVVLKMESLNSAGTCLAFYMMNPNGGANTDAGHFEIDVEIYGGEPTSAMLATNVFFAGQQSLAQFLLPFNFSSNFHNFTIVWSKQIIAWLVDDVTYRIINRQNANAWPEQVLLPQLSFWQPGYLSVKPDFSNGPITASLQTAVLSGCHYNSTSQDVGDCPTWTGTDLPWNRALTVQVSNDTGTYTEMYTGTDDYAYSTTVLHDWGWSSA